MPNIKSAKKALRQSARRRARNLTRQKQLKTAIKEYKRLVGDGDMNSAKEKLTLVYKTLDKAAKTKVIAKNKASRLKSRLSKTLVASS